MRYYIARYRDNGSIEYWSGRGYMFTSDKEKAARFQLSDAIAHAEWFNGFLEAS